jgi:hypothetical protein
MVASCAEDGDLLTEAWLQAAGFKWHQIERQPSKHWLLWLGDAIRAKDGSLTAHEDLGIEVAAAGDGSWFCWLRGDAAGKYHRFIHLRHLREIGGPGRDRRRAQWAAVGLANHCYGSLVSPEEARRQRAEANRFDRRLRDLGYAWSPAEEDPSLGGALPEHLEEHLTRGQHR